MKKQHSMYPVSNIYYNSKKKLFIALTQIYGISRYHSYQICDLLGISRDRRCKQLSGLQLENLQQLVHQNYTSSVEIKRTTLKNIQRYIKIASYRGFRHAQGLPVRGQRTHGNSRTRRVHKKYLSIS